MTLEEKENDLFKRWQQSLSVTDDKFAKDGVANEELFNKAKYKILFIAKETNDTGKDWDTRKYLREGVFYKSTQDYKDKNGKTRIEHTKDKPITKTFNNIYRWANLFLNDIKEYKEFKNVPNNNAKVEIKKGSPRIKLFSQIGMMNLKKTTGTHTTDCNELKKFVEHNNKYIKEQITLYKPDIIICCGKCVYSGYKKAMGNEQIKENELKGKFKTSKFKGEDYETIVIDFYHPQVRGKGASIKNHFNLLTSIKEEYNL